MIEWLLNGPFRTIPVTTCVSLRLSADYASPPSSFSRLIRHLPIVNLMMDELDSGTANALIGSLGRVMEVNGSVKWPCPGLLELSFVDCTDIDSSLLVEMIRIRSRSQAPSLGSQGAQGEGPVRLKRLYVESPWMKVEAYRCLRRILGRTAVGWNERGDEGLSSEPESEDVVK